MIVSSSRRQSTSTKLQGMKSKNGSHLDWFVVEEYPSIPKDGLARLLAEKNEDENIQNYCQRLQVTQTNMTVPIVLMILDSNQFSSLSKARKACRQGKILWKSAPTKSSDLSGAAVALVGDRIFPFQDMDQLLVRRETRQVLTRQPLSENSSTLPAATSPLAYHVPSLVRPPFELSVVYEDDFMAIVDKPAGVLVYPEAGKGRNNVLFALPYFLKRPPPNSSLITTIHDTVLERPVPVHRLDFATSGLLVTAKTKIAARYLAEQFEFRIARKTYTAMVYGTPLPEDGWETPVSVRPTNAAEALKRIPQQNQDDTTGTEMDGWNLADCFLDGKRTTTWWRILQSYHFVMHDDSTGGISMPISMIEMKPSTGRYHQLRRQMSYLYNTPIVGDPIYAKAYVESTFSNTTTLNRYHRGLMLCSNDIEIAHPFYNTFVGTRGEKMKIVDETRKLGSNLRKDSTGTVLLKASVDLPPKFVKFCKAMEKMTLHVTSYGD
ncbi:pseudouridylate synthase, 23S RNA-specific [Nitzschia inconspicua]|uniref:Pseudouridylate synthase, 23S RNA-specific n=1 Tax=Nitzschia inconspicua TaxID=303405 RepID=A0A9K3LB47_9STRA|nr:pseudouridylate synthase, 23S RNA-specific [Nitzschia inconspicua]